MSLGIINEGLVIGRAFLNDVITKHQTLRGGLRTVEDLFEKVRRISSGFEPPQLGSPKSPPRAPGGLLEKMMARQDPLLSIDWTASILQSKGSIGEAIPGIYIESIDLPSKSIGSKSVYRSGIEFGYADTVTTGPLGLKLYNDRTGTAMSFASDWYDDVYNTVTGNFKKPSEYKRTVRVSLLDTTQLKVYSLEMFGCWPTSITQSPLGNGTAELMPITIELSVDYMQVSLTSSDNTTTQEKVDSATTTDSPIDSTAIDLISA